MKKILTTVLVLVLILSACSGESTSETVTQAETFDEAYTNLVQKISNKENSFQYNTEALGLTISVDFDADAETMAVEISYGDEPLTYTLNSNDEVIESENISDEDINSFDITFNSFFETLISDFDTSTTQLGVENYKLEGTDFVATDITVDTELISGVFNSKLSNDSTYFELSVDSELGLVSTIIEFE